jgi:GrpB-like predicted nucleotidyltransferase (UPF0157 family)
MPAIVFPPALSQRNRTVDLVRIHVTNVHVFSSGCPEVERMLTFRDWLRANDADLALYERTKRELAQRDWAFVQNYADAKTEVVEAILARAVSGRPQP